MALRANRYLSRLPDNSPAHAAALVNRSGKRVDLGNGASTPSPAPLPDDQVDALAADFYPELSELPTLPAVRLVQGVIFDFDNTLACLRRPLAELMTEGARQAVAYMASTGMELPADFWEQILHARRFASEKSEEEQEEHIADDTMSFLLQFFNYPASRMDPNVLRTAVDLFYAPEMMAWQPLPGAAAALTALRRQGYRLALIANHSCDRVFQRLVDYTGLRPFFDLCICSASVEWRKPSSAIFNLALTHWDALPYEVVVVGDSLRHDIAGGLDAGCLTVQIQPPGTGVDDADAALALTVQPDATIEQLAALPPLIDQWAASA